uniref:Uncharacterized protein n=1 Tax=viral metagenome TaxID=1070528 RepID=A0A6C0H4F9_9ZZZZ
MTFKLNNSIRKFYNYLLKQANILNNKLEKVKVFNHFIFKYKIMKVFVAIIIFVLIFDKLTIFLVLLAINYYNSHKNKTSENYNNLSSRSAIENYYDNTSELAKVFKHPELNLNSYNDVLIDPEKVFLQGNKFLPECCFYNSEYSTSKGCACITPEQENYLLARGKNKSYLSFIQENDEYKNIYFSPTSVLKQNESQFVKHDTNYIVDYGPLNVNKLNEFNGLINLRP